MNHKGTQTIWIRDRHIVLRRFDEGDVRAMFDNWASDREVTKYLTWNAYTDIWNVLQKIEEWAESYKSPDFYLWAIEYEGELIGSISAETKIKAATDRADLGYCIGRKWWNKGIMTEAVKAVMDYMFSECRAHSCEISHCMDNPASGRVAEKCGMHRNGIIPEYFKANDGTWQDVAVWSILQKKWENSKVS